MASHTRMPDFAGKVVLLANYAPDQQESMQRFARMLETGLAQRGVAVETLRPKPILGGRGSGGLQKWLAYFDKLIAFPGVLKRRLAQFEPGDVLHICDHSNAVYTKFVSGVPNLVTCHDLLAVRSALGEFPENPTRRSGQAYQQLILTGLNRAQRIVCVSEATRNDASRLTTLSPRQLAVVANGLNTTFRPITLSEARDHLAKKFATVPTKFILHVGGNQWYKNRPGVIGIFHELLRRFEDASKLSLILIGKELPDSLAARIRGYGLADRVHSITNADDEDLRAFYSLADALLFPSLIEGFGWPVIEAQACGCPVATSNVAPLNEIGGDAAIYFDPHNRVEAAEILRTLLHEPDTARQQRRARALLNAARFSPDTMIDRYIEQYRMVTSLA